MFCEKVRRVKLPTDLMQGEGAIRNLLLHPEVLDLQVPHFAQTTPRGDSLRRRRVRVDFHADADAHVGEHGTRAECYGGGFHHSVVLGFARRECNYPLSEAQLLMQ